jgi:signal transduction histidine kinase
MIKGRTLKMDDFIRKILDYSRNSRREIRNESMDIHQASVEVLDSLKFISGFDSIDFQIKIPKGQRIMSDPERIKIILSNLLSNAIKYLDPNKEKPFVRISTTSSATAISITIEDNGIGIKSEHLSRIFEMFYRADESSDGSGIGLYIVSECINNLGGKISIQSEYRKGSTFVVSLPQTHVS